jgi:hypothetical protein
MPTIGPNHNYEGSKKQFCDKKSDKAFWVDILPFGDTLLGGDYSPGTVGAAGAAFAADKVREYAAGSPKTLLRIRTWTGVVSDTAGVPMTVTSKFLTGLGWAITVYSVYHAHEAANQSYQACMAN